MRLQPIRDFLNEKGYKYTYTEEDGCGSIDFTDRGLSYHIWEFPEDDGGFGVETNLAHAGQMEELHGDCTAELLRLLAPFG